MDPKTLRKNAAEQYDLAQKALADGDDTLATELEAEADGLIEKADKLEAIQAKHAKLKKPVMPAPLPEGGDDSPVLPDNEVETLTAEKALYQIRYGEPDQAIKTVLTDLHGKDFVQRRVDQKAAFNRYVRLGTRGIDRQQEALLKEIILTPDYALKAIEEGKNIAQLKATLVEAIDTLGGYGVPVDLQSEIITRLMGMTAVRGRAAQRNTSRDRVQYVKRTGGDDQYTGAVRITWVDETPTAGTADTNLTLGLEDIPVHTAMAETFVSKNLLEDAEYDIVGDLTEQFSEAAAIDEDNQFLTGDGVGKPQGILPGSANSLSLTEENSGDASLLTFDGLIGLTYAVAAQYRNNAVFIGERASYEAIAKLKDTTNQYLWRDQFGSNQATGGAGTRPLLGYPTVEQEAMPTVAANAFPLIFGDLMGYRIVDRIGMTVDRYDDSSTARQNLVVFVMRRRLGGQVTNTERFAVQKVSA